MHPQATIQIHATRSAPLCTECAHFLIDIPKAAGVCNHQSTPRHPITGEAVLPVNVMRSQYSNDSHCKGATAHCGFGAALFQPASSAAEVSDEKPVADAVKPRADLSQAAGDFVAQDAGHVLGSASTEEGRHQLGVSGSVSAAEGRVD